MKDYYPFIKCIHPITVVNQSTGKSIVTACGKCVACRNKKDYHYSTLCKLESLSHKQCYFCFLSYSEENVPVFDFIEADDEILMVDMNRDVGNILHTLPNNEETRNEILHYDKVNRSHMGCPFCYKKDIQLFIKRLRKRIYEKEQEKLRYFICCEFGPSTFRPHFHLLLWFDKEQTAQNLRNHISSCWRYGFINAEKSRGQSASYVASYLNGGCKLPSFLTTKFVRPFILHSNKLGQEILKLHKQEVYGSSFKHFNTRCINLDDKFKELSPWRSLTAQYFPRCRNYNLLTPYQRLKTYTLYHELSNSWHLYKPAEITKEVISQLYEIPFDISFRPPFERCPISTILELTDFTKYRRYLQTEEEYQEEKKRLFNQIYMIIRCSYQFCTFVCDHPTWYEFERKAKIIDEYYKYCEYERLKNFLEYQSTLDYETEEEYYQFYENYVEERKYKNNPLYKSFYHKQNRLNTDRIKTKKLNDKNNLLTI